MADQFDPYHKWLGISAKEQPPHHYRLLGIEPLESDPDVIESAADQRMRHVRSFQGGPHMAESQRLLNEISTAKGCLLDPAKKSAYDKVLAGKLAKQATDSAPKLGATRSRPSPRPAAAPIATASPSGQVEMVATLPANAAQASVATPGYSVVTQTGASPVHAPKKAGGVPIAAVVGALAVVIVLGLAGLLFVLPALTGGNVARKDPQKEPPKPKGTVGNAGKRPAVPPGGSKTGSTKPTAGNPGKTPASTTAGQKTVGASPVRIDWQAWSTGQPPVILAPRNKSFASLSRITGHFLGDGELLNLDADDKHQWRLGGVGFQPLSCTAIALHSPAREWFQDDVEQREWTRGQTPVRLIHQHDGFAVLSGVTGAFLDGGQEVRVALAPDGFWYLSGQTTFASRGRALVYRCKYPGKLKAEVKQYDWQPGVEKVRLLAQDEGLCFLSGIGGGFHGLGEDVHCEVGIDGHWHFWGEAKQASMHGSAISIKFPTPQAMKLAQQEPPSEPTTEPVVSPLPAPTAGKAAVPDSAALAAARERLADVLKSGDPAKLLAASEKRPADERYVLLASARDESIRGGEVALALKISNRLAESFDLDGFVQTTDALIALAKTVSTPDDAREVASAMLAHLELRKKLARSESPLALAEAAVAAAHKSKDSSLMGRAALALLEARRAQ